MKKSTSTTSAKSKNQNLAAPSNIIVSDSLAVKYRPKKLEDMIGNSSAKSIIQGMLNNKRFPNTLLIHGQTGFGKTTIARMLARYINCATGDACGICPSCRAGDASPDIVEMNMAETRGIDEIRALIGKAKLAPRFNQRIFILDELHQCFPENAEVLLYNGSYKRISELKVGDKVVSFNHDNKEIEISLVENSFSIKNEKEMVSVEVEGGYSQTCTADHKWWSVTRQMYVKAEDLFVNEHCLIFNSEKLKELQVIKVHRNLDHESKVYDITVKDNHNFFVRLGDSNSAALVHNCTPQAREAMLKPLEEPPKRTMWILCTTNPEKLSKTIIGRCQQISVEAPNSKEMTQYLISIVKKEGLKLSKERDLPILKHISECSMGHTRNALQLLETFVAIRSANEELTYEDILKSLAVSTEEDLDDIAAHLVASILKGEGKDAVKLLFQMKDKDPLGVAYKMRWLLEFKLNEWAGTMKFSPQINNLFLKYYGAKTAIKTVHVIKVLNTLVDCEVAIKTVVGLDPRMYFASKILNDMVSIVESSD